MNEIVSVALPAVLDLDALDGVRDRLIEALDRGPVSIIGAAVERVATNALLMLLSAAETAHRNRHGFKIASPSPHLLGAIERLGLSGNFADVLKG